MGQSRMFGDDEPSEGQSASPRTTIVGGRPPDDANATPAVPTGIQRLLRLATVDPSFREELVARRGEIAQAAGIMLTATEHRVLAAIPAEQLVAMIGNLPAPAPARRDFLRQTAATAVVLLGGAALGESLAGCNKPEPVPPPLPEPGPQGTGGPFAQPPPEPEPPRPDYNPTQTEGGAAPDVPPPRPDHNPMAPGGVRPDLEPTNVPPKPPTKTRGIQPDMPPDLGPAGGQRS